LVGLIVPPVFVPVEVVPVDVVVPLVPTETSDEAVMYPERFFALGPVSESEQAVVRARRTTAQAVRERRMVSIVAVVTERVCGRSPFWSAGKAGRVPDM
jgi:hypothetical protein